MVGPPALLDDNKDLRVTGRRIKANRLEKSHLPRATNEAEQSVILGIVKKAPKRRDRNVGDPLGKASSNFSGTRMFFLSATSMRCENRRAVRRSHIRQPHVL